MAHPRCCRSVFSRILPAMKTARLLSILIVLELASWAQSAPFLEISGDVPHPRTFQEQEWKQLRHVTITAANEHEKKTFTYAGVPLLDLLQTAGVPSGENLRGMALTTCVVITASDGYKVTFSIAELDSGIGNRQVIVADIEDGKPLSPTAGPLRLVVPDDKRPARWVRMVKSIRVVANP